MATSPDSVSYTAQNYGLLGPLPANYINIQDIPGADPTGNNDSTGAMQAAANALRDVGGGTLFFPPGTYRRTAPVVLYSNTRVLGAGGARIIRVGGFSNDWVFTNPNYAIYNNSTLPTSSALQTDSNYQVEGLIFESITICQMLFAANITIKDCFGNFSNAAPASFMQFRGCDNVLIEGNTALYCSAGVDIWQGCTRFKIINNTIKVFENVNALGNKYGMGVNALGPRNVAQIVDDILIDGNSIETNGGAPAIQFDTIENGSIIRNIRIVNNRFVAASGVNNYGVFGRGNIHQAKITNNAFKGFSANLSVVHLGSSFGSVKTGTDTISTVNGSAAVTVVYPNNTCSVGGWVRVQADPSGGTTPVGGLSFNGYYPVVAVSAGAFTDPTATVTFTAPSTASATATGGGPVNVVAYDGQPLRCDVSENTFVSCSSSGPIITANGTAHHICDNDMSACDAATYTALTFTDQLDRTASSTQWGCVVVGNVGSPGTGVGGASNSTRDAYTGLPLIIEPRTETSTPTWWVKGPTTFADLITLSGQSTAFTPTLLFGSANVGMVYVEQTGLYTRVGNLLFFQAKIHYSTKGSSTGIATVAGLPVPIVGSMANVSLGFTSGITSATSDIFFSYINSTQFRLDTGPVGGTTLTDTAFGGSVYLYYSGWYFTS